MKIKRLLAGVLVMIMLGAMGSASVCATADPQSQTQTEATATKTKPTQAPKNASTMGYANYVDYLETMYYKGNLGATYTKQETMFKLWSPLASDVKLCIYTTGTDSEENAQMISKTSMHLVEQYGTWVLNLKGDYKNKYYTYIVTVNGITNEVVDPYAKAVGANGDRGMIVDLDSTNPKDWDKDSFERVDSITDAVIWEVSVRDFSASASSGVSEKNRGKFLAFTEEGTVVDSVEGELSTCVDYLKDLGVNYVQINPFYDFHSIDETAKLDSQYNWGYDPKNYNVPEGSYSSDPYDGNVRIKECKQMIQALHKAGIGVIMDVVYNHTYFSKESWFNLIVPDYYYRINESGEWSNGSGCGNDTASERIMFREFMKNSVVYWADEYHIDGFRFDLMGLHDVDTMNYIRESLDKLKDGKKILMYGEAWNLDTYCDPDVMLANQGNMHLLSDRIAAFNDTIRDGIKGNVFEPKGKGFVQGGDGRSKVKSGIEGQCTSGSWGLAPTQCINYASCHDNLSLYDKLVTSVYPEETDFRLRYEDLVSMNKLSAAIVLTSQGTPFMMAGEEMARSKDGDENSYQSPVELNQIDWKNINQYADLVDYYKGLIDIRQHIDLFTDPTDDTANSITYIDDVADGVIAYTLKDGENTKSVAVIFNGSDKDTTVTLPSGLTSSWVVVANDKWAGIKNLGVVDDDKITVKATSCAILVDMESFLSYDDIDDRATVVVNYKDKATNTVVYQQLLKGAVGESYSVKHPNSLLYTYDITSVKGSLEGEFDNKSNTITVNLSKYGGDFSSVTVRFVNEYDEDIADSIVMTNRVGQNYCVPHIAGVYGYMIDLENLPTNITGKYTKEDITVTFKYNSIRVSAEEQAVDPEALDNKVCIANIIYVGSDGTVLDKKSYMGDRDTEIKIEYLEFDGYTYVSDSNDMYTFSPTETNIIVNYEKNSYTTIIVLSVVLAVVLINICAVVVLVYKRKGINVFKKSDDDLFIEE